MQSRIVQELSEIPLVCSVVGFWQRNIVLSLSAGVVKHGLQKIDARLTGTSVDGYIGEKLAYIKDSYPMLMKRPVKIMKKTRSRSTKFIKKKTRSVMNNFVGKTLIFGLDRVTYAAESTLRYLEPSERQRIPRPLEAGDKETSEKHVQTDAMRRTIPTSTKEQQTTLSGPEYAWADRIAQDGDKGVLHLFVRAILFPLHVMTSVLKKTRNFIKPPSYASYDGERRKSKRTIRPRPLSPEQVKEINERRKVSPRKRLNSSFFANIRNSALRILGYEEMASNVKQTDIRQFLTCSKHKELNECPLMCKEKRKRKHPELTDDSEPDEDLTNLDLDNYLSEDDPDYEPSDDDDDEDLSDDSIGTSEEEAEGSLEIENVDDINVQLKEEAREKRGPTKETSKVERTEQKTEKQSVSSTSSRTSSPKPNFLSPKTQHAPPSPKTFSSTLIGDTPVTTAQNTTPTSTQPKDTTQKKTEPKTPKEKSEKVQFRDSDQKNKNKETSKDTSKEVLREQLLNKENIQKSTQKEDKVPVSKK